MFGRLASPAALAQLGDWPIIAAHAPTNRIAIVLEQAARP
jgi:hypothetical protein